MLVSSRPKRDIVSLITEKMSKPVGAKGFGLAAKFERWVAEQKQGVGAHSQETPDMWPPQKRQLAPATLAMMLRGETIGEETYSCPEAMLRRLCDQTIPEKETAAAWQCRGCNTTDQRFLVKGADSTMTCSRCSVVAYGVKMVSTFREKACSAEDDRTQHADAPEKERDFYKGDEVETAEEARSRHARDSGGCCIPSKIRKHRGVGNVADKIKRAAASQHREAAEELSQLNCTRNRALQIELVGLCKVVAPVDAALQRHVRITAHQLLVRSQFHDNLCFSGCGISLVGVSAGLIAKVLLRVMAETLLPLHGRDECPFRFECSREELVGLIDRCNRLVLKEGVHSALCRTSIDILLNGDYKTSCRTNQETVVGFGDVSLAKIQSMEVIAGDAVSAVRDTIWSVSKIQTISDGVRDAALNSLRIACVRKWINEQAATSNCELVALRLARAVNDKIYPGNSQSQNTIIAAMQRSCQRSSTRMSSFNEDAAVTSIVANIDLVALAAGDDDVIM
jgi:hypothetical protein